MKVEACPFCGKSANIEDDDTLYPSGIGWKQHNDLGRTYHKFREVPKEQWCWTMHCPEVAGGCGAEIGGDTRDEAIANWNNRAIHEGYVVVPKEISGKMWSAGRDALRKVIDAYEEAQGYELRSAILDRGPEKIHEAMIAAGEQ